MDEDVQKRTTAREPREVEAGARRGLLEVS